MGSSTHLSGKGDALEVGHACSDIKGKAKMEVKEEVDSDITPPLLLDVHIQCAICLRKWMTQGGKRVCPKCRAVSPSKATENVKSENPKPIKRGLSLGDVASVTKRGGVFVTVPHDHFGPIMAENDPVKKQGVKVGDRWNSRMEARQWGVHRPLVSGISGQTKTGAQSVVLSGGYKDDVDHGDWFVYTGSGGRDLTGNKRTSKKQSSDQDFVKCNEALRVSCKKGYPVRVVRAYKHKQFKYAPDSGFRYDGIYRIERCWRIIGMEGFLVCRYLFVRCDNDPAPWSKDTQGDMPRHVPYVLGFNEAVDVCQRKERETPSWDFDLVDFCWKWKKPPPPSKAGITNNRKRKRIANNELQEDISEFLQNPQVNMELGVQIEIVQHGKERNVETSDTLDEEDMEDGYYDGGSDDDETI